MANIVEIVIKAVDQTSKGLSAPITNLASLEKVLNKVSPAALAVAGAVVGGFTAMVGSSINLADETSKLAQKLGMSTESLSTLGYAADLSGVSSEGLQTSLRKLNLSIVEGASQAGTMRQSYEAMGISLRTTDGSLRLTDEVMMEVSDRFAGMEDGAVKTKLAVELFGKTGADMIPMLNGGSQGLKQLQDEARGFGLEIGGASAKAAEEFNDNITRLKGALVGVANQVAVQVLPTLVGLSKEFVEAVSHSDLLKGAVEALGFTFKVFYAGLLSVWELFSMVGGSIGKLLAAAFEAATGNLSAATDILLQMVDDVEARLTNAKLKLADLFVPDPARAITAAQSSGKRISQAFIDAVDPKKLADSQMKLAQARADAEGQVSKAAADLELKLTEISYQQRTISMEEFYSRKKALSEESAQAEIDAQGQALDAIAAKLKDTPKDSPEQNDLAADHEKAVAKVITMSLKMKGDLAEIEKERVADVEKANNERITIEQDTASEITRLVEEEAASARKIGDELTLSKLKGVAQLFEAERQGYEQRRQQIDDLHLAEEADMESRLELQRQYFDRLHEIHAQALDARAELEEAQRTGNLEAAQAALDSEGGQRLADFQGRQAMVNEYVSMHNEAHRTMFSYMAEVAQSAYQGISSNITAAIMGTKSWGQAFAAIGQMMIETLVRLMVQRVAAFAMEQGLAMAGRALGLTMAKTSAVAAAGLAASWAPAATLATIATLGSAAGLGSLVIPMVSANTAFATAAATVGAVGAAHGGLDNVPDESTYLLQRGERVLSPRQNQDLTRFIQETKTFINDSASDHVRESVSSSSIDRQSMTSLLRESVAERLQSSSTVKGPSFVVAPSVMERSVAASVHRGTPEVDLLSRGESSAGPDARSQSLTVVINQTLDGEILSKTIYRGTRDGTIQVHPNGVSA